ncbi:hypothetical protein [Roseovarius sp.]|uniref:hypothetical protein n=1 Tax=Roseovarius sp. TaxID=1486281 RepID=UPI003D0A9DB6
MDKPRLPKSPIRNFEHLAKKDYYIAWVDELDIEAKLISRLEDDGAEHWQGIVITAMREALREIDQLKIAGRLDAEKARMKQRPEIAELEEKLDRIWPIIQRSNADFFEDWNNLRQGMKSPDPDQRARFNRFYEAAELGSKLPRDIADLIAVLEPAKIVKSPGRKPIAIPKWRNDTAALDEMLTLVAKGLSPKAASEKIARDEGSVREVSRAKRLADFFRDRQRLR